MPNRDFSLGKRPNALEISTISSNRGASHQAPSGKPRSFRGAAFPQMNNSFRPKRPLNPSESEKNQVWPPARSRSSSANCLCDLGNVTQVGAATPSEYVQPRHGQRNRLVLSREFLSIAVIKNLAFIQFRMA